MNLRGDQIVHIKLEIPKRITARQRELIEEFDKEEEEKNATGFSGFAHKAQDAWNRLKDYISPKDATTGTANDTKTKDEAKTADKS